MHGAQAREDPKNRHRGEARRAQLTFSLDVLGVRAGRGSETRWLKASALCVRAE